MERIEFCSTDIEELKTSCRALIEAALGRKVSDADPLWLFCNSLLAIIVQQRALINTAANENLLAFATGANLECLGELFDVHRLPATAAICTVELTLSAARATATTVRAGTRISTADNVHFALDDDVIFLAGETTKTAAATCTAEGEIGNGYLAGEINRIVDPQPFLATATNITTSEGGADIETDDDLRNRIRLAPSSFSVAGSRQAYEFWTKQAHNLVSDAFVNSPEPGYVDVYILLEGGEIPHDEILNLIQDYLSDERLRPLTDKVSVLPAEIISYDIDCKYFINRTDATQALSIKTAAEKAVQDFTNYQKNKLGRDIDSTYLIYKLREAGASRVIVDAPAFQVVPPNAVAIADNVNISYMGLKDE